MQQVTEGLNCHGHPDLIAVPEAIHDGACRRSHPDGDSHDGPSLDGIGEHLVGESHDPHRWIQEPRSAGFAVDRNPHFSRSLGPDAVNMKCGQQTNDRAGHPFSHYRKALVFIVVGTPNAIQSAADANRFPTAQEALKGTDGHPPFDQITGTEYGRKTCLHETIISNMQVGLYV